MFGFETPLVERKCNRYMYSLKNICVESAC